MFCYLFCNLSFQFKTNAFPYKSKTCKTSVIYTESMHTCYAIYMYIYIQVKYTCTYIHTSKEIQSVQFIFFFNFLNDFYYMYICILFVLYICIHAYFIHVYMHIIIYIYICIYTSTCCILYLTTPSD